ncbi:hypothetical protein ASJ30_14930 [Janibacter indicus]|uniref:Uncharacterized protein n=1 Tax=Janibacter indicus TaxID=857417 RepID=A0A1L3MK03_9MICO|nr:hypothetical protein [Janibacter indicus]APH02678.1 hypothetical protein ASJ30_14930 [Janibacter indicus]
MDSMYIVELKVEATDDSAVDPEGVYDRLVAHAVTWLSRDIEGEGQLDLSQSGTAELPARRGGFEFIKTLRWTVTRTHRVRAVHCKMSQPLEHGHGAQFICEFTLFQEESNTVFRIELGRESVSGLVSPVTVDFIRRPGLLALSVKDHDLRLTYQNQVVDGRFEWINPAHVPLLQESLAHERRLPMLLIDGGAEEAKEIGSRAAQEFAGLARVLLVDRASRAKMRGYLASIGAEIPEHGARLIWPVLDAQHEELTSLEPRAAFISTLMETVAPVSVAARGTNRWRLRAADENRRAREATFQAALAEAVAHGGQDAELETLRTRVAELDRELAQWLEEVERLTTENEALLDLKYQASYWKEQAERAYADTGDRPAEGWDPCPELDPDDMSELAEHLQQVSAGAIVFTAAAKRSWRKSGYPHVTAMQDALIKLARAAAEWRNKECDLGMTMKSWLKTAYGLNFSPEDVPLVRQKLHEFTHNGQSYEREPHLKLDDHVKPNEVGRIYFATDKENARFVVDHVGLKLYGI